MSEKLDALGWIALPITLFAFLFCWLVVWPLQWPLRYAFRFLVWSGAHFMRLIRWLPFPDIE